MVVGPEEDPVTMAIVSFDFDDTLLQTLPDEDWGLVEGGPNEPVLALLRAHAAAGDTVIVVTSRMEAHEARTGRTAVADFVREHALPVAAVHFTNGRPKAPTLVALGVDKHFDDDPEELAPLAAAGVEGVLVPLHPAWGSNPAPSA